ncbi:MAG: putative Sensor histidine kinase [Verrucomicrobiales bacterium]|nr:putative Sensor histidine kinase [Verrucomicrobiales bacterium]
MKDKRLYKIFLLAAAYFLVARFAWLFTIPPGHTTPLWPASGLALAAVLIWGRSAWLGIFVGAFFANTMNFFSASSLWSMSSSVLTGGVIASGATLEAICGGWILRKLSKANNPLNETAGVLVFALLAGFASCLISATIGVTALCIDGVMAWDNFGTVWWTWWLGDTVGVLVATPLFLNCKEPSWRPNTRARLIEAVCLMVLLIVDCMFVFGQFAGPSTSFLLYTVVPFLFWAAFRFGRKEAALVTVIISFFVVRGTMIGTSPLLGHNVSASFLLMDGFLIFAILNSLIFSSLVTERRMAESSLTAEAAHRLDIISTQQEIARIQMDLQGVMMLTCERAKQLTGAFGAVVEMCEGDEIIYKAASKGVEKMAGWRLHMNSSLSGECIKTGETLICHDTMTDERVDRPATVVNNVRSMVVTPLKYNEHGIGVLKVFSPEPNGFTHREAQTLQLLAGLVASAVKHAAAFEAKQTLLAERTTTLRALEESERRVRIILDTAYDAFITIDHRGIITDWNRQAEMIFGWSRGDALGSFVGELIFPRSLFGNDSGTLREILGFDSNDMGGNRRVELDLKRRKGEQFPVELTVTPIQFAKGKLFAIFIRDITGQKQREAAMRQSEQRFRTLAAASPVGIFENDATGACLYTNPRWQKIAGLTLEESLGDGWFKAIHPDDAETVVKTWKAAAEAGEQFSLEFRFKKASGEIRWVHSRATIVMAANGKITGYVGTSEDITERKLNEEKIRAALQEKEVLLKEVHHRVKNNLQVITSMLNLQAGYIDDPQMLDLFRECQIRIKTIALIHETLYQTVDLAQINFGDYTRNLTSYIASSMSLGKKQVKVKVEMLPVTFSVDTAVPCGLIVNELVTNSFKHAFPNRLEGTVTVSLTDAHEGQYTLSVSDDGIGLPEGFDFQQSNSLGLVLVHALAGQVDGTVEVVNESGTTFNITFSPKKQIS